MVALLAIEVLSETGFVFAWGRVVDPDDTLTGGAGGRRMDEHVAWMQLGGGLVLPGERARRLPFPPCVGRHDRGASRAC